MVVVETANPCGWMRTLSMAPEAARMPQATDPPSKAGPAAVEAVRQWVYEPRLDAGVLPAASEPVDIAELVSSVAADANFEARSGNRRVEIERSIPAVIQGDAGLLHSALENIVRNAVRYTAADTSVVLSLDRQQKQRDCLQIGIRDHGPGVPEELREQIFNPFVTSKKDGVGLGLAIVAKIVDDHHGTIRLDPSAERGASFRVFLPAAAKD